MSVQLGILFGLVAMIGWGISDFLGAYISRKATPFKAFFLTRAFATALLIVLLLSFFKPVTLSSFSVLLVLIAAGLYIFSGLAYYKGVTVGEVSIVVPVASSYPVITVILSVLFLNESLTYLQIVAIASAILGSLLTSFKLRDISRLSLKRISKGVNYAVFAAIGWGFMLLFVGILSNSLGWYLPILLMNVIGFAYLASYVKLYRKKISLPIKRIVAIILFSATLDVIAFLSYSVGTTITYIAIVATVSSVYPIITILFARFFFKEKLDANQWLGVLFVLFGLALLSV